MPQFTAPAAEVIGFSAITTGQLVIGGRVLLKGWAFRETTNAATARITLGDGVTTGQMPILPLTLGFNESARDWLGEAGLLCERGLFLDVNAGTVDASLWIIPETRIGPIAFAGLFARPPDVALYGTAEPVYPGFPGPG